MNPKTHTCLMSFAIYAASAAAADIHVPGDAPDIQAAIDLAEHGDQVIVASGVWTGAVDFLGKSIVVVASSGPSDTVIDGAGLPGFVVTIEAADAVLDGFTVTGGKGEAGSFGFPGGGIRIADATVTLSDLIVEGNRGVLGGAVSAHDSEIIVVDSEFRDNRALQGGAVYAELGTVSIAGSAFANNEAVNFGGAIALIGTADSRIDGGEFIENTASGFGGALYANHAAIAIAESLFEGNGRAEPLSDGVSWVVHTGGGGAIYTTSTSGRIVSSRLLDNVAAFGSALYVAGSGELELVNSLLAGNARLCNCGTAALYANSASPRVVNTTIAENGGFASLFTTYNAFPNVVNSVLAGNDVATAGNGITHLSWSVIDAPASSATLGSGVVLAEPLLDSGNDYGPLPGSPAIDAGSNAAVAADIETDLVGQPRFTDDPDTPDTGEGSAPVVDIGAIEFQPGTSSPGPHDPIFHNSFQVSS